MKSKKEIIIALQQCESYQKEFSKRVCALPCDRSVKCPIGDDYCLDCFWDKGLEWCIDEPTEDDAQTKRINAFKADFDVTS